MKKWLRDVPIVNGIIYVLYTWLVFGMYLFMAHYRGMKQLAIDLVLLLLCVTISWPLVYKAMQMLLQALSRRRRSDRKNGSSHAAGISFVVTVAYLAVWYAAFYPGFFSPDSMNQYQQVLSGTYSDWHPVLQTLFTFGMPLTLTGGMVGAVILFQMLCFACVLAYAIATIAKYAGSVWAILAQAVILLNPITGSILLYPWKDVTFAIFGLWAMTMAVQIHFSEGRWLDGWFSPILFGAVLACTTIFRHNAILFTAPLLLGVLLSTGKARGWRKRITVIIVFVTVLFTVKGPLYKALHVEQPGQRQIETMGLPMTVMGNVAKEQPERLTNDMQELLYSVAPREVWEDVYQTGNFNTIKFYPDVKLDAVELVSRGDLLRMTGVCFRTASYVACRGLFVLIGIVLIPARAFSCPMDLYLQVQDAGIPITGSEALQSQLIGYARLVGSGIGGVLFGSIGLWLLLIVIAILVRWNVGKGHEWKAIFIAGAIVVYNLGTMLFLTGNDYRFFYITYLVAPLVWLMALRRKEKVV